MSLYPPSVLFVALRYMKGSRKQRFASFVAILATLGIAIGVAALIVVSSIMQGLQERLKANILTDCAHVVVKASYDDLKYLLNIPNVNAVTPYAAGEAMMQYGDNIIMVNLQGQDYNRLYISFNYASKIGLYSNKGDKRQEVTNSEQTKRSGDFPVILNIPTPKNDKDGYSYGSQFRFEPNTYNLAVNYQNLMQFGISAETGEKVRLISTQNARYTPFGMTPVQRNFKVNGVIYSMDTSATPTVIGNYMDVRRFLLIGPDEIYFRMYLVDPFAIDKVTPHLDGKFEYSDWREHYGEFFKAVSLERITMSIMLCLIIIVAAFNILSSLTMVVSSRVSEIAILKTIGMTNSSLLTIFILVGMSASIIGSVLGLLIGIPFALNAQTILSSIGISIVSGELPIAIDGANLVWIVLLCMVVSMVCTFYPAYCASRTDPARNLVGV